MMSTPTPAIASSPSVASVSAHRIAELAQHVLAGGRLDRSHALELAATRNDLLYDLFYWANRIRLHFFGSRVSLCSIVPARVGACSEDCAFCSQSRFHKTHVVPGRLSLDQIERALDQALAAGASCFSVVTSGRAPSDRDLDTLEPFFRRAAARPIRLAASLGQLTPAQARRLRDMGLSRLHHNLETSRRHFPTIIRTHTYDDRLRTVQIARDLGFSVCSGGIFGLGETWEDRIDLALELRDLGVDSVPLNFLNPIPGTAAYGRWPLLPPLEALKIIALFRFLLPDRDIKVAGGRDRILRDLVSWIFFAGASSFMIGNYLTTPGRPIEQDHQLLRDLNLTPASASFPSVSSVSLPLIHQNPTDAASPV